MEARLRKSRATALLRVVALVPLALIAVLLPAQPDRPSLRATAATGNVELTDSRGGGAIVSAAGMDPGDSVTGTVTIANSGDAAAALTLSKSQLEDTLGSGGGRLSEALFLTVDEVAASRRAYDGPLAAMGPLPLAPIPARGRREFRFTVRLPALPPAYETAATSVRFDWTGKAVPKPAPKPPSDIQPPVLVLDGKRRQRVTRRGVVLYARCSERCTVVPRVVVRGLPGVRRGTVKPRTAIAAAGKRVAIRVRFNRRARRLLRMRRAVRRARVVVTVTARDGAGNVTVRRRTIRPIPWRWSRPGGPLGVGTR